jgi:hypothetical protein
VVLPGRTYFKSTFFLTPEVTFVSPEVPTVRVGILNGKAMHAEQTSIDPHTRRDLINGRHTPGEVQFVCRSI